MKNILFGCRFVSCLLVLTIVIHWKVLVLAFQLTFQQAEVLNGSLGWSVYFTSISVLFVMLNLIAAIGLFGVKKWGFKVGYLAILCTTIIGISYLPLTYKGFYHHFLSQPSIIPVIMINLVLLSYVIYLDVSHRKASKN